MVFGGTERQHAAPEAVAPAIRFRTISVADRHLCGLDVAGDAWCAGANDVGQLGRATGSALVRQPVRVAELPADRWAMIATSTDQTCGLTRAGKLHCWGSGY